MSQDPRGRRLSKPEKEAILNDIRSRSLSFQSISKKHRVSISTVSRLAPENGLSSPRKRSSAVEKPEHSYDREQRVSVLDKMLASIDRMVSREGLSSRQLKDLAGAAKEVPATRRQEDTHPYGPGSLESAHGKAGEVTSYESLASLDERGIPWNIAANFGLLDIEIARNSDDAEGEETAKERVRKACVEAGLSGDIPLDTLDRMIEIALDEQEASEHSAEEKEYQGEGLA